MFQLCRLTVFTVLRGRSRSRSPRRSRRSRSRSRDRSGRSGGGTGPDLLQMSYDEYLEHFERVRQQKAAAAYSASPGPASQVGLDALAH